MKFSLLSLLIFIFAGCSLLQPQPRSLTLERQWVRSSYDVPYNGYRLYHQMQPLIYEDLLFEGNAVDGFAAYKRKSGALVWKMPVANGSISGAQAVKDGHSDVPDKVYFGGSDGQFYCVGAYTGNLVWTFPTRVENLSPPLVEDGVVYFLSGNDTVYALDASTGKQKWVYTRTQTSDLSIRGGTRPAIYQNILYVGFRDGYLAALHVKDGSLAWERLLNTNLRFKDIDASPIIDGKNIYVSGYDNALYSLSRDDGQMVWKTEEGSGFPATVVGNRVYYATSSGALKALDKASGKELWSKPIGHGIATQPIAFKNYLLYGESAGELKVVNIEDGQDVVSYNSGQGMLAAPAVQMDSGDVYFMSNQGNIFALKLYQKRLSEVRGSSL